MINIGVIGYGYWGPNLVRNFQEAADSKVLTVCDLKPQNLALAQKRYPAVKTTTRVEDLFRDPRLQAIAISTPVHSHYELGMKALRAGKHVFMEKPLAANSKQALELVREAKKRKRVLFVDHTFVYTGAVRKIKEMVAKGQLGQIYYYDSVRVNLGLFQHDVNVLWDLAVHDLSIMDFVLGQKPVAVSATGLSNVPGQPENIAYLTCFFKRNLIAHIHVNWLAPVKIRKTLIGGDKKMVVYDDVEVAEKVKVYEKGVVVTDKPEGIYKLMVDYRSGDIWAPHLDNTEALRSEVACFVDCVKGKAKSVSDGQAGLRIVRILEAASASMTRGGRPVRLDWKKIHS